MIKRRNQKEADRNMRITIKDVAIRAGVSPASVSNVLHGRGRNVRVSPATAEAIRNAAKELRYGPQTSGSQPSARQIALLVPKEFLAKAQGAVFAQVVEGIRDVVAEAGIELVLGPRKDSPSLAGVLLIGDSDLLATLGSRPTPTVGLLSPGIESAVEGARSIFPDYRASMEEAVLHLRDLGHHRIALASPAQVTNLADQQALADAFHRAMDRFELPTSDPLVLGPSSPSFETWWSSFPPETALVSTDENLSRSILDECERLRIEVPAQLSLISVEPEVGSFGCRPRLTSIHQPIRTMATSAVQVLLRLLEGSAPVPTLLSFGCRFEVRDSTAAPQRRGTPNEKSVYAY